MRYSKEYKLECIKKHKKGERIQDSGGCKHKTFHNKVRHWFRIYDKLGEVGLEHKKLELTIEDKIEICNRVSNGEAINEDFTISNFLEYKTIKTNVNWTFGVKLNSCS